MRVAKNITAKSLLVLILLFTCTLNAQLYEKNEPDTDDFDMIRKGAKSANMAIFLSTVFPGSGHFYVNKKSVGTFLFPVVEIALWTTLFYFRNQGNQIEKDYENYADLIFFNGIGEIQKAEEELETLGIILDLTPN